MQPAQPFYPSLETLGFADSDLASWRVDRGAAESFVRGLVVGRPFNEALAHCRPPLTSLTFALALAQAVTCWREQRPGSRTSPIPGQPRLGPS